MSMAKSGIIWFVSGLALSGPGLPRAQENVQQAAPQVPASPSAEPTPSAEERAQARRVHEERRKHKDKYANSEYLSPAADAGQPYKFNKNGEPIAPASKLRKKGKGARRKHKKAASAAKKEAAAATPDARASQEEESGGAEATATARTAGEEPKKKQLQPMDGFNSSTKPASY